MEEGEARVPRSLGPDGAPGFGKREREATGNRRRWWEQQEPERSQPFGALPHQKQL